MEYRSDENKITEDSLTSQEKMFESNLHNYVSCNTVLHYSNVAPDYFNAAKNCNFNLPANLNEVLMVMLENRSAIGWLQSEELLGDD